MSQNGEYCTDADKQLIEEAMSFRELQMIGQRVLDRMPPPVTMICGPMTNGGRGSLEANMQAFNEAVERLRGQGRMVFNQAEFQKAMIRILKDLPKDALHLYPDELLTEFYQLLFESKKIHCLAFLPGWETSRGADWEHQQAQRLNIRIEYLA